MILPGGVINISLMSLDSAWSEKDINSIVSAQFSVGRPKTKFSKMADLAYIWPVHLYISNMKLVFEWFMEQNFQFCKPFFHCLGPNGQAEAQTTTKNNFGIWLLSLVPRCYGRSTVCHSLTKLSKLILWIKVRLGKKYFTYKTMLSVIILKMNCKLCNKSWKQVLKILYFLYNSELAECPNILWVGHSVRFWGFCPKIIFHSKSS